MLFDKTIDGLTAAVYYAGLRHKVIAHNIANADTPGYKASNISFREQLEDFMKSRERGSAPVSLAPPTLFFVPDPTSYEPKIDNNTVNLDQELTKLSQNTILHNTYLQLLSNKFKLIKSAISENA